MNNIRLNYLYRDRSNYKRWSAVIFSNNEGILVDAIAEALRRSFLFRELFIAHQVRLPEAFFATGAMADPDDHCFHEYHSVEFTSGQPNDSCGRSAREFVMEVKRQADRGWHGFDPLDTLQPM